MDMQKQYRCLVLLTDMNMGGVTTSAVNFCNGLCERGTQVDILLMSECQDVSKHGLSEKIRILQLGGWPGLWNLGIKTVRKAKNPVKKIGYLLLGGMKKLLDKKQLWVRVVFGNRKMFSGYDVVVAYRQCQPCYYFALHNVKAKKKVGFIHGDLAFMGDISTWQPLMPQFDAVAYVSDAVKDGFIRHYLELEKNAVTVYNTFQTEEIKRKAQLPCDVAFDLNRMNLVTVSRIENEVKGTGRIAPICQLLKERYPGRFHWYVVGGGRDLECCKSQAEALDLTDHLTFLGPRNNPFPVLAKADLCVLTTFTEAYPMVIGESLILGVPAVTTRYPAAEEIILDGCNGIIADQSIESVFEKISQLFDDRDLYSEIKKTCELFEYDNDRSYKQFWESIGL